MTKFLLLTLVIISSTSCIKTAEQVNREKRFESISEQVQDSQGLVADLVNQMKDMQNQLNKMNGRIEELEHRQKQVNPEQLNKMSENLAFVKTKQESDSAQLTQIQGELKEQRAFMEKLMASLGSMKSAPASKTSKKKSAKYELNDAIALLQQGKNTAARMELETLIDHEDLTPGEKNKVLFNLGRAEYNSGNHEKALVYFSKIYTKFPKSSIAPSSLLFIGRSLNKLGKKDEAKEAFAKVTEDYPGTKEANEAKKEI